jgi:hypothetical protein
VVAKAILRFVTREPKPETLLVFGCVGKEATMRQVLELNDEFKAGCYAPFRGSS